MILPDKQLTNKQIGDALDKALPLFITKLKPEMKKQIIQKAIHLYEKSNIRSAPIIEAINDLGKVMNQKGGRKKTCVKRKRRRKVTRRKNHSKTQRGGWPPRYLLMIGLLLTTLLTQAATQPPAAPPEEWWYGWTSPPSMRL